jgi:adenine-specific DNA-methyltransferase
MPFEIRKTELVWPGKYDEEGIRREPPRASLPFQVIERVNESRATREADKRRDLTLFDVWKGDEGETFEEGWRNKLIWGENALVMNSLLDQFAGRLDFCYIDPPFATGADFSFTAVVGDDELELDKEQSTVEEKAYSDTWGAGATSYLTMMSERLELIRGLLADEGTMIVHCDWHMSSHIRLLLDEVFGRDRFLNEIVWTYKRWTTRVSLLPRLHDTLFWYAKGQKYVFNQPMVPNVTPNPSQYVSAKDSRGRTVVLRDEEGRPIKRDVRDEIPVADYWDVPLMSPVSVERVGFPTQKPERLLARLVEMATEPGALVADFFSGSGTTMAVAEKLGRRWIDCDLGRFGIHLTRKRLLEIAGCRPFEILNLGKYERQYWQVATFGEDLDEDGSIALYEYVVFILKLYGASALSGMGSLHGRFGKAFVHVGAVDSPVTIHEIAEAVEECTKVKGSELHVLGWEWEMGVNDLMVEQAKREDVKLLLRQIPREVMEGHAARGDVRFFELAYVDLEVKPTKKKREVVVSLKDFAIPNPELVPDEVRAKIKKWSDYVDYWAVDWDFSDDTFMQGWVAYRTRRDRSLELKSDPHSYEKSGGYAVMVKLIDIFGNDTSKVARIQVK